MTVQVKDKNPKLKYFSSYNYQTITVVGGARTARERMQSNIDDFVNPWSFWAIDPDAKTAAWLSKLAPAFFGTITTIEPDCDAAYICILQVTNFVHKRTAGTILDVHAKAWSKATGNAADIREFVSPEQLSSFTESAKSQIAKADCFYGFDIDLPAKYSSFPDWVPVEGGVRLWFPEYQFACQIVEIKVDI
jgi:hypothetical protein